MNGGPPGASFAPRAVANDGHPGALPPAETGENFATLTNACQDPLNCFLAAYDEYLAGTRLYEDLLPAFTTCPTTLNCGMTVCAQCHPGTAALYDQARVVSAYFRLRDDVYP